MTHIAMHKCQHVHISGSMVLAVLLFFFKTQLLSNGLVKYEFVSAPQAGTYWQSYYDILIGCSSLPSRALFYRTRSLLLSSLSISFALSLANVGSDILVLGAFLLTSQSPLTLIIWFEHVQIIGKEARHNREHMLLSRTCSVSQTGHADRRTSSEQSNVGLAQACPQLYWPIVNRMYTSTAL